MVIIGEDRMLIKVSIKRQFTVSWIFNWYQRCLLCWKNLRSVKF